MSPPRVHQVTREQLTRPISARSTYYVCAARYCYRMDHSLMVSIWQAELTFIHKCWYQ